MKKFFKDEVCCNRTAARNLKVLVMQTNKKQDELEHEMGLPDSTLYKYTNGKRNIEYVDAKRFAEYFNTSIDYMLGLTMNEKEKLSEIERLIELFIIYIYPFYKNEEWAKKIGIDKVILGKIKNAYRTGEKYCPNTNTMNKIADYFCIPVEWLTNGRIDNAQKQKISKHNEQMVFEELKKQNEELQKQNERLMSMLNLFTEGE